MVVKNIYFYNCIVYVFLTGHFSTIHLKFYCTRDEILVEDFILLLSILNFNNVMSILIITLNNNSILH